MPCTTSLTIMQTTKTTKHENERRKIPVPEAIRLGEMETGNIGGRKFAHMKDGIYSMTETQT